MFREQVRDWAAAHVPSDWRSGQFVDETSKKNAQYVWSTDGVDNWFKGTVGSTSLVLPLTNLAVWQEGQDPDMSVYLTSS